MRQRKVSAIQRAVFVLQAVAAAALAWCFVVLFAGPDWVPDYVDVAGRLVGLFSGSALAAGATLLLTLPALATGRRMRDEGRFVWPAVAVRAFHVLSLAAAAVVLLAFAVLHPLQPRLVELRHPSDAGCRVYATRLGPQDAGSFVVRSAGSPALYETGARWARVGDADPQNDIKITWNGETPSIRPSDPQSGVTFSPDAEKLVHC